MLFFALTGSESKQRGTECIYVRKWYPGNFQFGKKESKLGIQLFTNDLKLCLKIAVIPVEIYLRRGAGFKVAMQT